MALVRDELITMRQTNPFTPGPTANTLPAGDVERQAVASLRGYAYQVAAAALA